jgi:hypothetical protein
LILSLLERGLGLSRQPKVKLFHDLDYLAGTWNEEDIKQFEQNVKSFEMVDKDLWE